MLHKMVLTFESEKHDENFQMKAIQQQVRVDLFTAQFFKVLKLEVESNQIESKSIS